MSSITSIISLVIRYPCICFLIMTHGSIVLAQSPKEYLLKAMEACGPWGSAHSFHYVSDRTNTNPWQSYSYVKPQPAYNKAEFYLDIDKGSYQNHTVFNFPGGYVFDLITIGKDSTRYAYDKNKSRNGEVLIKGGKDSYTANMFTGFQGLPYYIAKSLAETNDSLTYGNGSDEITISRFLKKGDRLDYLFDSKTNLLKKIERIAGGKKFQNIFDNYKPYGALKLPTSIKQTTNGEVTGTESIRAFEHDLKITPAVFTVPGDYKLQQGAAPQPLAAKAIAKDVYLIEGVGGDRNIMFVNMDDYIIVTEAPLSADITKTVLDVIHTQIPGKPVKYVHLSHHHNDHTSGIRQMVAEGAIIICTAPVEAPVRAIINGALGAPADDYSKAPKQPQFELISSRRVLKDKEHRVEFHTIKNSHAEGLSFMYLPKEGVIYEGDLLTIPEDGTITPAIKVSKEFETYIKRNGLSYKRIIGHHSHSFITPGMFKKMLSAK